MIQGDEFCDHTAEFDGDDYMRAMQALAALEAAKAAEFPVSTTGHN